MSPLIEDAVRAYWLGAGYGDVDLARIAALYDRFRRWNRLETDGAVAGALEERRLTLGFQKALTLIALAELQSADHLLNPFGGGGGIGRVAALRSPAEIVMGDIAYGDAAIATVGFRLEVESMWSHWVGALEQEGLSPPATVLRTCHWDARVLNEEWIGRFRCIVLDPPFGNASARIGMPARIGKEALLGVMRHARRYLASGGRVVAIYPREWSLQVREEARTCGLWMREELLTGRTTRAIVLG